MKRIANSSVLLILATILFSMSVKAENVFLKPVTGNGISAEDLLSIDELLQISVRNNQESLVDNESKATITLEPRMIKIGSTYILSVSKFRDKKIVFQQKGKAKTLEDMDTVTNRVVRAVLTEATFEKDGGVSDVTDDEINKGSKRKQTTRQWVLGLGPGFASGLNTGKSSVAWTIGYQWEIDGQAAIILAFDWLSIKDSNARFSNFYIGGDYFLNERNTSPFLQGAFGYGSAAGDNQNSYLANGTAGGFSATAGAGVKFFRSSSVNLGLLIKYTYIFDDTSYGKPGATMVNLSVYF